ncbi:MAG TPA: Tat pathway signal sequence domain protein, partial [Rhodospirillaceae bacterium]|nr:Tat pathway signal sequence domain protein [Rhodospirillaceae bacterium]
MNRRIKTVLAAALIVAGFSLSAGTASAVEKGRIGVELNKLEAAGDACRAYLLLSNGTAAAFTSLKLDLVTFDGDGIVQRRVAVEAAPIGAGKTSLK